MVIMGSEVCIVFVVIRRASSSQKLCWADINLIRLFLLFTIGSGLSFFRVLRCLFGVDSSWVLEVHAHLMHQKSLLSSAVTRRYAL